eukprot:NODE_21380_length_756_cov_3.219396.p2 GENE.NODE_21380_length_756_cov_3.219396~~NODE_21380_length_756_cov_3.219396.p2  ORF type:complete len:136 (-),score=37.72 NODE_21380_length_756_cov_3.219396:253-660(-)
MSIRDNFSGLVATQEDAPALQKALWRDLVKGHPEIEDSLSLNGRLMKADMYSKMFKESTDLEHPCRIVGSQYIVCLRDNFRDTRAGREAQCSAAFAAFDGCRKGLVTDQGEAHLAAMRKQEAADVQARSLFRKVL